MSDGKYLVARQEDTYFLKMTGNLKYTISSNLDNFLNKIFQDHDFENVLIDLTDAEYIDSTNLGLLAKIARWMNNEYNRRVTVISTNNSITELLKILCLDEVFIIVDRPTDVNKNLRELPHVNSSEIKMTKIILEAHKDLMELSEKNQATFKNVVELLQNGMNK